MSPLYRKDLKRRSFFHTHSLPVTTSISLSESFSVIVFCLLCHHYFILVAFADWVASSNSQGDDLSLGFNARGGGGGPGSGSGSGGWSSNRTINYGLPPDVGVVGLRDVFMVAPASSFHHLHPHVHHQQHDQILADHAACAGAVHNSSSSANANTNAAATMLGVGMGVFPLLSSTPCHGVEDSEANNSRSRLHLWQNQLQGHGNFFQKVTLDENSDAGGEGEPRMGLAHGSAGSSRSGGLGGGTTCQDCGNQAKKDCSHRRCRTCCKSRGFECSTHVRSTWVPAARRRERAAGSSSSTKKPRLISSQTTTASHTSTSNTTPPRSYDTSSSHQDASFKESLPGQVRANAVFKCVRVTSMDDAEDEYAYHAVVNIGGHVFKGFLYDQGVDGGEGIPNISDLHLGGGSSRRNAPASSTLPTLDPSDVYTASGGAFLGGTTYGNQID